MSPRFIFFLVVCLATGHIGCSRPVPDVAVPPNSSSAFAPTRLGDRPGLHNVFRLTDRLYSGSSPEGDAGFRSLRELGIVVVVSVDGATPEVETARRHGLRYAHLPIGYDGVPRDTALRIARVVRDSSGPVYVHCHHGQHRGPAAAIAVARCLDERCDARTALDFLTAAGTDPRYKGLFADVERVGNALPGELDRVTELPETAVVPDLTRLMVAVDERWDRLKAVKAAGWKTPPNHPDVDPAHEAVQLAELYREAARLPAVTREPAMRRGFIEAERLARELEAALRSKDGDRTEVLFRASGVTCTGCHGGHRDVPRSAGRTD
ncbi:MAG: hypothetical protein K8U57_13760 [Planctomycetes bacterium]|nr:hypothetical protein [Planctomycetota bacterium]